MNVYTARGSNSAISFLPPFATIYIYPLELILSYGPHFGRNLSFCDVNRKSLKFFSFVTMAEIMGMYLMCTIPEPTIRKGNRIILR